MLELIASTYGAPEEVAAAYRDTEVKVKAALKSAAASHRAKSRRCARFFGVFLDARAYIFALLTCCSTLATGIVYFTFVVVGLSLSAGFAILIIGVPFFLVFIGIARVIALGEGRLLEAITGERMPRRPVHPGHRGRLVDAASARCSRTYAPGRRLLYLLADAAARHHLLHRRGYRARHRRDLARHAAGGAGAATWPSCRATSLPRSLQIDDRHAWRRTAPMIGIRCSPFSPGS